MENSILIRNISVEELQKVIRSAIKEELQVLMPKRGESSNLTRNEVTAFLKISLPTLQRYTQLGVIKGFRIGTRILYKLEDVEESLKSIETSRYRR